MISRRSSVRPGLSLIEVLLSLAILVIALAAISQLVDAGSDRAAAARNATRGARLAQGKMAEVEAGVVSLTSSTEGDFTDEDAAWKFSVIPEPSGPPNLYTVTVKVTLETKGQLNEFVLTQMIFDPMMMGSAAQAERPPPADPAADPATTGMGGTTP